MRARTARSLPDHTSSDRFAGYYSGAGRMVRQRVSLEVLRTRGYASVTEVGDEFVGVVTHGADYHEFVRGSLMEATHAVRDFIRKCDIRVQEIVVRARDGHAVEAQGGE